MDRHIVLVPIGPVPGDLLAWLRERLAEALSRKVAIGEEIPLPTAGYNTRRGQYSADTVITALRAVAYPDAGRVIGLIDADCYAPGLNFVFGQATLGGREAFIALARLRESFYGRSEDEQRFRERALKEALHELGHTWGLGHCPDPRCVMHFSNSIEDTDIKGAVFCPHCPAPAPVAGVHP